MRAPSHQKTAHKKTAHKKRLFKNLMRLIGPLLLVWALSQIENPKELIRQFSNANPLLFGSAVALNVVVVLLKIIRWKHLLSNIEYTYPLKRTSSAMLSSMYLGMITPGRVGDILRAQYTKHDLHMPYSKGLASVFADRLFDLVSLLFMVSIGGLFLLHTIGVERIYLFLILLLASIVMLAALLLLKKGKIKIPASIPFFKTNPKTDANASNEPFLVTLKKILQKKWQTPLILSTAAFLLNYLQGFLLGKAFGISISFIEVLCVLSISSLLSLLPISISGVGVREAFLTFAFPLFGLSASEGVLFGLSIFAVIFIPVILTGFIVWQISPPPIVDIQKTQATS